VIAYTPPGNCEKQGTELMRWPLVEAGQSAAQYDSELRRKYQPLKFRCGAPAGSLGWGFSYRGFFLIQETMAKPDHYLTVASNCGTVPTSQLD
jgi:hypothetical protein